MTTPISLVGTVVEAFENALAQPPLPLRVAEVGTVQSIVSGVVQVTGLPGVRSNELLFLESRDEGGQLRVPGLAFNLDPERVGVVLLGSADDVEAGNEVRRSSRVLDVPVGNGLIGRVLDPLGAPLDSRGPLRFVDRYPVERDAPPILDRAPVTRPLQTGVKSIDALVPIGRGQRELLVGDRQTGKTAVAIDTIINQADKDVVCIYCSISQRSAATARVIEELREQGAMAYTIVVVASGDGPPGLQFIAPYAATAIGEYFMERGRDVLVVYDDLSSHARAYRELSLLLRRPPGREAFPGDIFYIHSRLLERATQLREERGGGSLTALPVVETEGQNIAAYIPTNLISITDGQVYLSPQLFRKGVLPAVDVGRSVSRVGGQSQLPAYRKAVKSLRLSYAQFEELEMFARFGTRLDESTRHALAHGRRVRRVLTQPQYQPVPVAEQVAVMVSAAEHVFDQVPLDAVDDAQNRLRVAMGRELLDVRRRIESTGQLTDEDKALLLLTASRIAAELTPEPEEGSEEQPSE